MSGATGKIARRRKRIMESIRKQSKPLKVLARELGLSNSIVKKDVNELIVIRALEIKADKTICIVH